LLLVFVLLTGSFLFSVFVFLSGSLKFHVFVSHLGQKPRIERGNNLDVPASVVWVADVEVAKLVLCIHWPDRQAHQGASYKVKITQKKLLNHSKSVHVTVHRFRILPRCLHKVTLRVIRPG